MDEPPITEYDRVRPLFEPIDYQRPAVFAVLEGRQAGRVFVDRRDRPTAALIWSDGCYLAGCASNAAFSADLLSLLYTEVMPRTEHLLIYAFTDDWRDTLDDLLRQDGVRRVNRTVFDSAILNMAVLARDFQFLRAELGPRGSSASDF